MTKCALCVHEKRDTINEALVAGELRSTIARRYGVSEEVVARHATEHLPTILEKEGLNHSYSILMGMSGKDLQERLRLVNEILELQKGLVNDELTKILFEE